MASTAWTQAQWAMAFVRTLGNLSPAQNMIDFVEGWGREEGGGGSLVQGSTNSCNGNVLNTEYRTATSTNCTPGGVQSFASNNDGVYANAMALRSGYPYLLQALVTNDSNALGYNGYAMSQGIAEDLSYWVSGSRTARLDYAASVAAAAGAKGPANVASSSATSSTTGGTATSSSSSSSSSGSSSGGFSLTNPATWLPSIIGQNATNWIENPTRILKMLAGIVCIGIALFLLAAPAENAVTQAVQPIVKSAAVFA